MAATVRWNRLTIATEGDDAFKTAVNKNLGDLFKQPYQDLELDIGQCKGVGEEAFKVVGLKLVDQAGSKRLTVRVPEEMRGYFEGSGLSDLVSVRVLTRLDAKTNLGGDEAEAEPGELLPESQELARDPNDTNPPMGEISATKAQNKAVGGTLVDDEDHRRFPIGDELIIGREAPANVVYQIPTISKKHFRIYLQGPAYFIEDMRSTNGTYLNGDPLTQPHPLGEGDEIVVAITLKHPDGARRFKFTSKG